MILENIQKSKTDIIELICIKYKVDSDSDYGDFIKQLLNEKILVISNEECLY